MQQGWSLHLHDVTRGWSLHLHDVRGNAARLGPTFLSHERTQKSAAYLSYHSQNIHLRNEVTKLRTCMKSLQQMFLESVTLARPERHADSSVNERPERHAARLEPTLTRCHKAWMSQSQSHVQQGRRPQLTRCHEGMNAPKKLVQSPYGSKCIHEILNHKAWMSESYSHMQQGQRL